MNSFRTIKIDCSNVTASKIKLIESNQSCFERHLLVKIKYRCIIASGNKILILVTFSVR